MNKNIIAGAILAALSTAAAAQSSVTVYGIVDAGLTFEGSAVADRSSAKKGNKLGLNSGNMAGSRLGFRGQEDLGNGLSAIFTLESGYDVTNGDHTQSGLLMGRQAFVGLQGNFGAIKLGRQYTPYDSILGAADTSNGLLSLRSPNIIGNAAGGFGFIGEDYTVRKDNVVQYETPNFAGVTATVAYGFGEVQGDNAAGRMIGANVQYKNEGLWIGVGHQQENRNGYTKRTPNAADPLNPVTNFIASGKRTDTIAGISYDFGVAKINALYSKAKRAQDNNPTAKDLKEDAFQVGVSAPFGAHKVMFSYSHIKNQSEAAKGKAVQYGLGYTYDMSKRTTVYASLAKISNKDEAKYTVGTTMNPAGIGETGATVGIRHAF